MLSLIHIFRERNQSASIIMVSEENELPYDRPMLTKNMFGAISGGAIASKEAAWYEDNCIDLRLGVKAESMDLGRKEIRLSDGTVLPYNKCCLLYTSILSWRWEMEEKLDFSGFFSREKFF